MTIKLGTNSQGVFITLDRYDQIKLREFLQISGFFYQYSFIEVTCDFISKQKIINTFFKNVFDIFLIRDLEHEWGWSRIIDDKFCLLAPIVLMQDDEEGVGYFLSATTGDYRNYEAEKLFKTNETILQLSKNNQDDLRKVLNIYSFPTVQLFLRFVFSRFLFSRVMDFDFDKRGFLKVEANIDRFNKSISNITWSDERKSK